MDGGHKAVLEAEIVVDGLGDRSQAVGGAGGVGDDAVFGLELMGLLAAVNRDSGKTVIVVTHDPATAAYARRQILVRDGRVAQD